MIKYNIGTIIKSPISSEFIKGPIYWLKKEFVKEIVKSLKLESKWNQQYLDNNAIEIDVFDYSNDFANEYKDILNTEYSYFFGTFDVTDYLEEQFLDKGLSLSTNGKSVNRGFFLGHETSRVILNEFPEICDEKIIVDEIMKKRFFETKWNKDFFEFDFEHYQYCLEMNTTDKYLIGANEGWWFLENTSPMPLNLLIV